MKKLFIIIKLVLKQIKSEILVKLGKYDLIERNLDGITYYYSPVFVNSRSALFALVVKNYETNKNLIIVDDNFEKASKNTRLFTLNHEIGHTVHGHTELSPEECMKENKKRSDPNYLSKFELDADDYAYNILGKEASIEAFEELIEFLSKNYISTTEVKKRLEVIRNK